MIGAAASKSEAEREARSSIEELANPNRADWEGARGDLARYFACGCDFPTLDLIQNREMAAGIFIEMSSLGQLLICHGCDDVEAVIVAFLVHEQREQAWALCGACLRKLPLSGAVT